MTVILSNITAHIICHINHDLNIYSLITHECRINSKGWHKTTYFTIKKQYLSPHLWRIHAELNVYKWAN